MTLRMNALDNFAKQPDSGVRKSRALSICFFGHSAGANGAERSLASLVKDLVSQYGTICTVFVPERGLLEDLIRDAGASCVVASYPWWCYAPHDGKTYASLREDLSAGLASYATELLPQVREINPDVICTQTVVIPWGAAVAAALGKPHVWSVCEYGELDHGLRFAPSFQAIAADIEQGSDFIFFNSKDIKNTLFRNLAEHRWDVLYRHVEIESPCDMAYAPSPSAPLQLIIVGTLAASKGQADAIAALALLKERGLAAELTIVGAGYAEYVAELHRCVADLDLAKEVHFVDFLMNPFRLVSKSDIVLVCSRREAFGRVAVEAMLLGKPVVYAAAGGVTEYMRDGETGMGYPPGDTIALADRIETLIRDAGLRMRMGTAAQAHARATFSRDGFAGKFYRKALELRDSLSIARFPATLLPSIEKALGAVEKAEKATIETLKAEKAAIETSLAEVRRDAAALSATLDECTRQLAEAQAKVTTLEASAARPRVLDEGHLRTARFGVRLRAAWRHPRNSRKRKAYRARHMWAALTATPDERTPRAAHLRTSPFRVKLRATWRHPLNSRKRKVYRSRHVWAPLPEVPSESNPNSRFARKLQALLRHPFSSKLRKLYRAGEHGWPDVVDNQRRTPDEGLQDNGATHPAALPHPRERHPGGFRAETLAALRPFDDIIAEWRDRPRTFRPLSPNSLRAKLRATAAPETSCILSFSHDNYRASVGGIQLCVLLEEEAFRRAGTSYIHLSPLQPLPVLAATTSPSAYHFAISLNGTFLGHVLASDLIHAVALQKARGVRHKLVIHSLLGHSPEVVMELCEAAGLRQGIYWLHDYFALCPSYTLMRNYVSHCSAPPPSSLACHICHTGAHRIEHLDRMRQLFTTMALTVVAPSQSALSVWRRSADFPTKNTIVQEHCKLEREVISQPNSTDLSAPLRVAFLGFPSLHKGWPVFCDVVQGCEGDQRYAFYHFARSKPKSLPKSIIFQQTEATTSDRQAMSKALSSNNIDVAFLCSLWPETYNFTAVEALAGGALIITLSSSGNIAAVVKEHECGLAFDDEAILSDAFVTGKLAREIRDLQHRNLRYAYTFSNMSADIVLEEASAEMVVQSDSAR
jgi:glycosyltransferase involved in cell wall biosynthesis